MCYILIEKSIAFRIKLDFFELWACDELHWNELLLNHWKGGRTDISAGNRENGNEEAKLVKMRKALKAYLIS